jgi:hypothetical protein
VDSNGARDIEFLTQQDRSMPARQRGMGMDEIDSLAPVQFADP